MTRTSNAGLLVNEEWVYPSENSPPPLTQPARSASFHVFFSHLVELYSLFVAHALLVLCFSTVSVVLKERRSKDSVTLAWQGPERPNGAIVEYEVIYYEKVTEIANDAHALIFQRGTSTSISHTVYLLWKACVTKCLILGGSSF